MSTIRQLETIMSDAWEKELVEFVDVKPDYITVVLRDTKRVQETLLSLVNHIKGNFPAVRYFHIDAIRLTFTIYHFNDLHHTQLQSQRDGE